jgi:hypothetical protein
MNRPRVHARVHGTLPQLVVLAGLAVFGSGLTVAQAQDSQAQNQTAAAPAGQRTDGQIEMDVVHALDASAALKDDMITAATIQGEVSLSGTVSTEASKELAEAISAHVAGVTKVNNNLKVGNPQDAQAADPSAGAQQADNNPPDDAAQAPGAQASNGQQPMPDQGEANQPPAQGQYPDQGQAQAPPPPAYPPARPQYAPQPQYPNQYPSQQGQYAQGPPPPPPGPQYQQPTGPVTIPQGTLLQLRTSEALTASAPKTANRCSSL